MAVLAGTAAFDGMLAKINHAEVPLGQTPWHHHEGGPQHFVLQFLVAYLARGGTVLQSGASAYPSI
jgi:hypothetical protein